MLIENVAELFWIVDMHNERFLYVSQAVEQIRGYTVAEMTAENILSVMGAESAEYIQKLIPTRMQRFIDGISETYVDEIQLTCKDGSLIWTEVTSGFFKDESTGHIQAYGVARDISERLQIEQQVRQLSQAVQQSPTSIVITSKDGDILYVNPKFTDVTGYSYEEALGKNPRILKTNMTPPEVHTELWHTLTCGKVWRGEFCNRKKNGELYWESASISPIFDRNRNISSYVAVKEDITERKNIDLALRAANERLSQQLEEIQKLQAALREQAIRDPLTGMYNRRYLYEILRQEFSRARRGDTPLSIIMLDFDHFKDLNDQYGHAAGDAILQELAGVLQSRTRKSDTVCRYGGEEILIAMPNTSLEQAQQRARDLLEDISQVKTPFEGQWLSITVSIGIAAFPQHGETIDAVIRATDHALYASKEKGRNRVTVYSL
jgi:diguanylate cyclase (GGDEF)-like protein/PAS domain S-box-containing protein